MSKEIIIPQGTDASKMPFSSAVRVGNLLFLSGSAGLDKEGKVAGPDIESQARQAFENLGEVLEAAGSSWDKVVKVIGFLTDPGRDISGWNKVFVEYFPKDPPARSTVGASLIGDDWLIEVDIMATV